MKSGGHRSLSIRMQIFLPIVLILLAFSAAVWLAFSHALDLNMNNSARRDLDEAVREVRALIDEAESAGKDPESAGQGERDRGNGGTDGEITETEEAPADDRQNDGNFRAPADFGGLLARIQEYMQTGGGETRMLAMNDKFRVLYPRNYSDQTEITAIYTLALTELTQENAGWEAGAILQEEASGNLYLIDYEPVFAEGEEIRYILLYCPIHDTSAILASALRLMFLIMAGMSGAAIVLSWFVAGSISGPVRRLSAAARGIGEKKFRHVETGAKVRELCELEEEINRMQEKLSQADQAERTFFQNASHELRTPLMSISGYAQGIQCGVFADSSQAAGIILEESNRLTEVVDGILTLTRMDQLRYQLVPVLLPLREFLKERIERLEGLAYAKNIRLVLEPGEEYKAVADAQLLERAVSNVISNCIRYAGEEVRIRLEKEEEWLFLTVSDDGPGIREEDIGHLFDRFYKGKDGNHGLGLAIAKSSLEYMGAEIRAVPHEGGAVFAIKLPQDCRSFTMEDAEEL